MIYSRIPYDACPLCASALTISHHQAPRKLDSRYSYEIPLVIEWVRCEACAHVFASGYFSDEAAKAIYANPDPKQMIGQASDMEEHRLISAKIVARVNGYLDEPNTGYWLDVGFGNGSLLFTAHEFGFSPIGIELNAENVERYSALGVPAYLTKIEHFTAPDAGLNVISMADVLEHEPFPVQALKAAHKLMNPQGVLFLSMPNMSSVIWSIMDANAANPYWAEFEHYHNFTRERLYALLDETGFAPVNYDVSQRYRCGMEVIATKKEL